MKKIAVCIITFLLFLNVHAESSKIVYYNLNSKGNIIIDTSSLEVKLDNSSTIQINDFSSYQGILKSGDSTKYPTYIIDTFGEYSFSDFKKSGTNIYVLSSKMLEIATSSGTTNITSCNDLLGYKLINLLKNNVFQLIYLAIPVILIVTSTFDFAKLVFSDTKDGIPGAIKRFSRRVMAAILIFLVPTILTFLVNLIGNDEVKTCIDTFKSTENVSE